VLKRIPQVINQPDATTHIPQGAISIMNASWLHDSHPILHDISVEIPRGQHVGIVGATGAGKSSLLSLLLRLRDPDRGSILFDGIDAKTIDLYTLRQGLAYVPQEHMLFSMTLQENVMLGTPHAQSNDLAHALNVSCLDRDIAQLANGLDTIVGERGTMLSGGQKQRLGIARAIITDAPVMIFDDALSNIDAHTANDIVQNISSARRGKTTIMVSQKISAVRHLDAIIVLDQGKLAEYGTHEQLLAYNGIYAQLYQRELSAH
jgi:ATP-binding cassette subfamily B multidrug efflux pump